MAVRGGFAAPRTAAGAGPRDAALGVDRLLMYPLLSAPACPLPLENPADVLAYLAAHARLPR